MPEPTTFSTIAPMLSPDGFAALLDIRRRTFQSWRAAGKLPKPDLIEGRVIRWRAETIQAWLEKRAKLQA